MQEQLVEFTPGQDDGKQKINIVKITNEARSNQNKSIRLKNKTVTGSDPYDSSTEKPITASVTDSTPLILVDNYNNPALILASLNKINHAMLNVDKYIATLRNGPRLPGGALDPLYNVVNITYNGENITKKINNEVRATNTAGLDDTESFTPKVKKSWQYTGCINRSTLIEIRTYAKQKDPLIKRIQKIKIARSLGGGHEIISCDNVTPTFFWDDKNHAAIQKMLEDQQWYELIYGFCIVGFPKDPLKWAANQHILTQYDEFVKEFTTVSNSPDPSLGDSGRSKRFGSNFHGRISENFRYQELLPCIILDPAELGDIMVYLDTDTGCTEYSLSPNTPIASELMKNFRLTVYMPSSADLQVDSSNKINTGVACMLEKYKNYQYYEVMAASVAAEKAKQLILLETQLKFKDENKMTDQELNVTASASNRPDISSSPAHRLSSDLTSRTVISADSLNALLSIARAETTSSYNSRNTTLNLENRRNDTLISPGKSVLNPIDTITLADLDRLRYKALDVNNLQSQQTANSFSRVPEIFRIAGVHRPEFTTNIDKIRADYEHDLFVALGVPPALLDSGRLSSKSSNNKSSTGHTSSETTETMGIALGATINNMRNSMCEFFDYFYCESMGVLESRRIEEIVARLKFLAGTMAFRMNLKDYLRSLLKNGYNAIVNMQAPLEETEEEEEEDSVTTTSNKTKTKTKKQKGKEEEEEFVSKRPDKIQKTEEERPVREDVEEQNDFTLRRKVNLILKELDDGNPVIKWINENFKSLSRLIFVLEHRLNQDASSRVRLVFKQTEEEAALESAALKPGKLKKK